MREIIRVPSALVVLFLFASAPLLGQTGPLVHERLIVQGNRLTIFSNDQTTDANQVLDIGEQAQVRTCFGGPTVPCGSVKPGDPRIAGLEVRAELRGPELPVPQELTTVPGGTFLLPGFQQEGDYRLENIRMVSTADGQVVGFAEPSVAVLQVRQIVLASTSVRTLSLEELQARGITVNEENFQAVDFAVGFALEDQVVEIKFPVIYHGNGQVEAVSKPKVVLDGLPDDVIAQVQRWKPPQIVPFRLEKEPLEEGLDISAEGEEELLFPVYGVIVIPGTITYLNQFFEAELMVANGAPNGSDVTLEKMRATVKLPRDLSLRLAATDPPVSPGQEVPIVGPGGLRTFRPGQQGSAKWTVEGLRPGTHVLSMDISGEIVRPGRDPLPVLSRAQAAVEVVDARFHLTFSHPNVVQDGTEYTLYVTVTNQSQQVQNLVSVEIRDEHMVGAEPVDPTDNMIRTIESLEPNQSETLEYELRSLVTGKVVATTFQSESFNVLGTILLRTGVGELGIPLSPTTLLMPRFTEYLQPPHQPDNDLVRSHVRLYSLAYSLAVAPTSKLPPGVPFVKTDDIERRAIDLAEAGQRLFLQEQLLETLEAFALDQLGNRHALSGYDELRRRTDKGLRSAGHLARYLRMEQENRSLDALALFDHFSETMSYTRPFLMAMLVPETGSPAPDLQLLDMEANALLAGGTENEEQAVRTLPWGEIFSLQKAASGGDRVPLAVVGRLDLDQTLQALLVNSTSETARGQLVLMVPDGDTRSYRKVNFGLVAVPPGSTLAVDVGAGTANPSSGGFRLYDASSGTPAGSTPTASPVPLPPFRIIGSRQDFRMAERGPDILGNWHRPNRYGNGISYLFNRPPDEASVQNGESWNIYSTFEGETVLGDPASGFTDKDGTGAWLQPNSERVVNVRYAGPISAYIDPADGTTLSEHEHRLDLVAIQDTFGGSLAEMPPPPIVETTPLHTGGLVEGYVVRGTGETVPGAIVKLVRLRKYFTLDGYIIKRDLAATFETDATGRFFFDYVEEPHWDGVVLRNFVVQATVPEGDDPILEPAEIEEVSSIIRQLNKVAKFNIALLGRGSVTGKLVYLDTQGPAKKGRVIGASTLFNEIKSVSINEDDGTFRIDSLPVGPITLTGSDEDGRKVYATIGIDYPGEVEEVLLEIQRNVPNEDTGTVRGRVLRFDDGELEPAVEAKVAVYSNGRIISQKTIDDPEGSFEFTKVPVGRVSLQAADFRISRTPAFTDLILEANEVAEVDLRIAEVDTHVVTGLVQFRDPITDSLIPIEGAVAFIQGPGNFAYTDATGRYRIEGVPSQGVGESYSLKVIDFNRQQEANVALPPILDVSPEVIEAQPVILESMRGSVRGVALDPLGRPAPGVGVVLLPFAEGVAGPDGSFVFENVPLGDYEVVIHEGDGLQPGKVGWIGSRPTSVIYGGHSPFVTVQMRGGGGIRVKTRTATSTGILTPLFYRPTYYSSAAKNIVLRGSYTETSTNPLGDFETAMPVGPFNLVAYNPFHGVREINGEIEYPGHIVDIDILFEDAGKVRGTVVGVDGITPVPNVEVTLFTKAFEPQRQFAGPDGSFLFELVPKGSVVVTAEGFVGTVQRVGRTQAYLTSSGQEIDILVQMKAQGSVKGQVKETINNSTTPLSFAQYYVRENSFPFRRLPEAPNTYFTADVDGRYEVSHIFAGRVTVNARDPYQVNREGSATSQITADWQVRQMPDIVMKTSVGDLEVLVRDPVTGGPVADAQVKLSTGEWTISGADGRALWESLPLGTYSVYAFNAPTGQSGRVGNLRITAPGQLVRGTVYLDQRGTIAGTLWEDALRIMPVPGGTVRLSGNTAGGRVEALATTSGSPGIEGTFAFEGIPEGTFQLAAGVQGTPRRAAAEASITDTNPEALIDMILEPIGDLHFKLYESLSTGPSEIDTSSGIFSLRLTQGGSKPGSVAYDFTRLDPDPGTGTYFYPDILMNRGLSTKAQEVTGEQRSKSQGFSRASEVTLPGDGTAASPFQIQLSPKGVVQVTVRDANGVLVPQANVNLGNFPGVTNQDGQVSYYAVPVGNVTATATSVVTGSAGRASGTLVYDDDVLLLDITLAPAVSAQGVVYQPLPDDAPTNDPALLIPMEGAIVSFTDSSGDTLVRLTDAFGRYRFDALQVGQYSVAAQDNNGDQFTSSGGSLDGPDGFLNSIPPLILDASPPRIISLTPPAGFEGVSRRAQVEIIFSEPLDPTRLASGNNPTYFRLRSANGSIPAGQWTSTIEDGRQAVRFVPSEDYENLTTYSLTIIGGSGGVRDLRLRPLTDFGNVGTNFKTSDSVGPGVLRTEPAFDRPMDPTASIRVDFTEAVTATDEQLDGDGTGDAARLFGLNGDGVWVPLPVVLFLTQQNYSLQVEPLQGFSIDGDTLQRRLVISGLLDVFGNPMPEWEGTFRIYDENPPVLDAVPFPAESGGTADLVGGIRYNLIPQISGLDELTPENPGGDVDRVDFYVSDPEDLANPTQPAFSARDYPFTYSFVGAYTGNGVDPRPFPVWVQVVDTSTNESDIVLVDMQVLPNTPPTLDSVTQEAISPVAGVFYAGSRIRATIFGVEDIDANQLTLSAELRREGTGQVLDVRAGQTLTRPAGGWQDLAPPELTFDIPLDEAEGQNLYVRAVVIDAFGASAEVESDRFAVADDANGPQIDSLVLRRDDNTTQLQFFIGERFRVQFRARDLETAIDSSRVEVRFDRDDIFPSPVVATRVNSDLYRTDFIDVRPDLFFERTAIVATVSAFDQGDNENTRDIHFDVAPEPDPTAPVARWLTPWQDAEWPADYSSVLPQDGTDFLLRAHVSDLALDEDENEVPGTIVEVRFRGPIVTDTGAVELAPDWQVGELVTGTDGPGEGIYQLLWQVPNQIPAGTVLPFAVRAVDTGGKVTQQVVQMLSVDALRVFEGVQTTISRDNDLLIPGEGDENGPVFLLDGSLVSLQPQNDGTVRSVPGLFVYAGGDFDGSNNLVVRTSSLTAPEINTYDSAITHRNLELEVQRVLGVGHGASIDMDGRGLLGRRGDDRVILLNGQIGPESWAGGSHGGLGWNGSWGGSDPTDPGHTYDSLRDPHLPGTGGGTSGNNSTGGGTGGGVIRLFAENATVHLAGDITARGKAGNGGGGAGGALRLVFGTVSGGGLIDASGGPGSNRNVAGGGGGGRISLSYHELDGFDPDTSMVAEGGGTAASSPRRFAGAGTIYVEQLDDFGLPVDGGRLLLRNAPGLPSAFTPLPTLGEGLLVAADSVEGSLTLDLAVLHDILVGDLIALDWNGGLSTARFGILDQALVADVGAPEGTYVRLFVDALAVDLETLETELALGTEVSYRGVGRLGSIDATGAVRMVALDDLEMGPDSAPVINDRSFITTDAEARVALRTDVPEAIFTTVPEGGDVLLGSSLQVSWSVFDPLGLLEIRERWSLDMEDTVTTFTDAPIAAGPADTLGADPFTVTVPFDTPSGEVTYTVTATDVLGRTATSSAAWNVLGNATPTATVAMDGGAPAVARAGYDITLAIHAEDTEGLALVELLTTGPATPPTQSVPVTGMSADFTVVFSVPADAAGDVPITVQAQVTDATGEQGLSDPLVISVTPNDLPTATLTLADGAPSILKPEESTTLAIHAEDPDGLTLVELRAVGPVTPDSQTVAVSGTSTDQTFDLSVPKTATPGPVSVTAVITDIFGATFETAPLNLEVIPNALPTGTVVFADGTPAEVLPGSTVTVEVNGADEEGLAEIVLTVTGPATPVLSARPVSGTAASESFELTVSQTALSTEQLEVSAEIRDIFGNPATVVGPITLPIAGDGTPPTVGFSGVESEYRSGEILTATLTATDEVGVARVDVTFDGETTTFTDGGPTYELVTEIDRTITTSREVTFSVTATDFANNTSDPVEQSVTLIPDLAPTVVLTQLPSAAVLPGSVIEVQAAASDDVVIERLEFVMTGAVLDNEIRVLGTQTADETFRRTLPTDLEGGDQVTVTVSALDDFGHITQEAVTYTISGDVQLPVPTIDLDPETAGDTYFAGDGITVTATASDNVGVSSISLDVDGTVTEGGSLVIYNWIAPAVSDITTFDLVAEATDPAGNVGTVTRTVTVEPLENAGRPEVRFDCLSSGATLPSGDSLALNVVAMDDLGVSQVELFRDDEITPFAVLTPSSGAEPIFSDGTTVTLPLALGGETTVRYRAVAHDASFNTGETEITLHVVETVDLFADGAGTNNWSALESQVAVLRGGTLTVDEARTLGGLIVLDGAITHSHTSPSDDKRLELDVQGPVYVACPGELDAAHRGYRHGHTYPGANAPGSGGGGSHIGLGGLNPGTTYGSIYRPLESGGGGENSNDGDRGGGVIRLQAQDRLVVDGAVLANGEGPSDRSNTRGGGGGSIWLSVDGLLAGEGRIEVQGGRSEAGTYGSGGGGAIALEYSESAGSWLERTTAFGGDNHRRGGAGSILLKRPESIYGDLIIDAGTVDGQPTDLPELGAGTALAGSGSGNLETDLTPAAYFVGHYVEIFDGTSLELEGVYRVAEIIGGLLVLETTDGVPPSVDPGDLWQGAYYFDNMTLRGSIPLLRTDVLRVTGNVEIDGQVILDEIAAGSMRLRQNARLTHPETPSPSDPRGLTIDLSGDLVIEAGAAIDVSHKGYRHGHTYPGANAPGGGGGGSHIGRGGLNPGSTYGSVYRPQENGGGGENSNDGDRGGGVLRLFADNILLQDGTSAIRANGEGPSDRTNTRGGAGGSIWITAEGSIAGPGVIEARGGDSESGTYGSGGGGAIALEYGAALDPVLEANLTARGGSNYREGGAGSIYLKGPASVYGDLLLSNGSVENGITHLPALGTGTAVSGSTGGRLETDRFTIPPYFVGHWVEIRTAGGALKGTWRIAAVDGTAVILEPGTGAPPSVNPGDGWQGVYRFDNYEVQGDLPVLSPDPIRVSDTQVIDGEVEVREIVAGNLVLRSGAVLSHPPSNDPANPESLLIQLSGTLTVEAGAFIDASKKGFRHSHTYPGESSPGGGGGGSHIGKGGSNAGSTYGSVYQPQENGGGGENSNDGDRGGGVVRIEAQHLVVDGAILANGEGPSDRPNTRGGAGGSVWITLTGTLSGDGSIEVVGGQSETGNYGSGGGGAIAVYHEGASGTVLDNLLAYGGDNHSRGGAGSVYLHGPGSIYGDLIVDNSTIIGAPTVLPAMGGGIAQAGSGGAALVTEQGSIQPYFVGHWVEVRNPAGVLEGTWRVAAIDGGTLTLEPNGLEPVTVSVGDAWQGVYRFDNYEVAGSINVVSDDPIRVEVAQVMSGSVELRHISARDLILRPGTVLTHPLTTSEANPERLLIELSGDLVLEDGAVIDASERGYRHSWTYPGATRPGGNGGGSHIGRGGSNSGSAYGSVYRPREAGGGGENSNDGDRGGGIVEIVAQNLELRGTTSAVRANGEGPSDRTNTRGGAGGSVWIRVAGQVSGDGSIEAKGGASESGNRGSGGGGAIAIEYAGTSGTVLQNLRAFGGDHLQHGGAGSVYLLGPGATFGDLLIDNADVTGHWTELPALGGGTALAGTVGSTLVTDRATAVPAYFEGHYVEIYDDSNVHRGTWRIVGVSGFTVDLEPNGDFGSPALQPGWQWQGVYRFDNMTVRGTVPLASEDPILVADTQTLDGVVTLREVMAHDLVLTDNSIAQHPLYELSRFETLEIDLTGDLIVGAGASIDVSERGYRHNDRYPGEAAPGGNGGGSHMGLGGSNPGSTYGSLYRPHEYGGGGENSNDGDRGGGIVRIFAAGDLWLTAADSSIRANGEGESGRPNTRGGAGGSVWIEVGGLVRGTGSIEAMGGASESGNRGSGGGGAIAIYHGGTDGTVLDNLRAQGGDHVQQGGTGTIYLHGPTSTDGDLHLDAGPVDSNWTQLPSLGAGTAQAGSAGDLLVTDRASVQAYFVGHWVEITSGVDGSFEGRYRIVEITGGTLRLDGAADVSEGDGFQGAYYFDNLFTLGDVPYRSVDPIRTQDQIVFGPGEVLTELIQGGNLTLQSGAILRHVESTPANPRSVVIELAGDFVLESGATIDASKRGYRYNLTYPGASGPGGGGGGSHLGLGGFNPGTTYGSVYRPFENGGGGENSNDGDRGGGVVKITAQNVTLDGIIDAYGEGPSGRSNTRGGAGGSVWIEARGILGGDGSIHAYGGSSESGTYGSGGGGAVALYYDTASGTLLDNVTVRGGTQYREGGAGTLYLRSGTDTHGRLIVDNIDVTGRDTVLPTFGSGTAQAGTAGDLLVTDLASIPDYFVGHWIEVNSGGSLVGRWRIAEIDGLQARLAANGSETLSLQPGYTFVGAYQFDAVTVTGGARLVSVDPIYESGVLLTTPLGLTAEPNQSAPKLFEQSVELDVGSVPGSYRIRVAADAFDDGDGISELWLSNGFDRETQPWQDGATFHWTGAPGDRLTLTAVDNHGELAYGRELHLPALPAPSSFGLELAAPSMGPNFEAPLAGPIETMKSTPMDLPADERFAGGVAGTSDLWLSFIEGGSAIEGTTEEGSAKTETGVLILRKSLSTGDHEVLARLPWIHDRAKAWRRSNGAGGGNGYGDGHGPVFIHGAWHRPADGTPIDPERSVDVILVVHDTLGSSPSLYPLPMSAVALGVDHYGVLVANGDQLQWLSLEPGTDEPTMTHVVEINAKAISAAAAQTGENQRTVVLTESSVLIFDTSGDAPLLVKQLDGHAYDQASWPEKLHLEHHSSNSRLDLDPDYPYNNLLPFQSTDGFVPVLNGAGELLWSTPTQDTGR